MFAHPFGPHIFGNKPVQWVHLYYGMIHPLFYACKLSGRNLAAESISRVITRKMIWI
jgi:hypothetical protein